jgi:hypothetical protein
VVAGARAHFAEHVSIDSHDASPAALDGDDLVRTSLTALSEQF